MEKREKKNSLAKKILHVVRGEKFQSMIFFAVLAAIIVASDLLVYYNYSSLFRYLGVNDDAAVYLYQANLLSHGIVSYQIPDNLVKFFDYIWFFVREKNTFYPKYYPGFALALVPWVKFNLPIWTYFALVNSLIIFFILKITQIFTSEKKFLFFAVLMAGFSSPFLFLSSMLLTYSLFTLLVAAGSFFFLRFLATQKSFKLALSSSFLGYAIFTRPYEGLFVFLASFFFLVVFLLVKHFPCRKIVVNLLYFGFPAVLFLLLILFYNKVTTGTYGQIPFQKFAKKDNIGFGVKGIFDIDNIYYGPKEAWNKTKIVFEKIFTPGIFGNLYLGLAAYVLIITNFIKKPDYKKTYLLLIIALGFLLDFYHWVQYSLIILANQPGYFYLLYIVPFVTILFLVSGSEQKGSSRYIFYGMFATVLIFSPFTYKQAYRYYSTANQKRNELGQKYDELDKKNSIIFLDKFLLFGDSSFIVPDNAPLLSDPIVAEDQGPTNKDLMDMFPSKKVYILKNGDFARIR